MTLYYNNIDITEQVTISEAVHTDCANGRCDSLELSFLNPTHWYAWQPVPDDIIRFEHNGYDTGDMYVSAFFPEDGMYKITALSVPQKARTKRWMAFKGAKLTDILFACSRECGMEYGLYGIDDRTAYDFILRRNEGVAAFLNRVCAYEGAVLKCVNGKLTVIGIEYAQNRDPARTMTIDATTPGVTYARRSDLSVRKMTVRHRKGVISAVDNAAGTDVEIISDAPATSASDASRWARGLLIGSNRKVETLTIDTTFDPGISAMQRIDVDSSTAMDGAWLVDSVTHDFINLTTNITLARCVEV